LYYQVFDEAKKHLMKRIFKIHPKKVKPVANRPINDKAASVKIIHTGRVLSVDDINKNRSSKYSYLVFDFS